MTDEAPCPNYREWLTAWVDGELRDPTQVAALEEHLSGCEGCQMYAEAEAATKTLVATTYAGPVDVSALRARVHRKLGPKARSRRWGFVWKPRPAWGVAAVLVAAIVVAYLAVQPRSSVEASPLIRASVETHVECMLGSLSLDFTTTDQKRVNQWLRARLGRSLSRPIPSPEGEANMSVRFGRLASVEGAQILVDRGGRMYSLFIMPLPATRGTLGRKVVRGGRELSVTRFQGYTVVFWRQGDLLYCLVSDSDEEAALGLAAEYSGPSGA